MLLGHIRIHRHIYVYIIYESLFVKKTIEKNHLPDYTNDCGLKLG